VSVDPCALITEAEVLKATKAKSFSGPPIPARVGVGEHVRERIEGRDLFLEVLNGQHYLSVSLDDGAKLVKDLPGLARALLKTAFARLP
jgi:hypothetical protein